MAVDAVAIKDAVVFPGAINDAEEAILVNRISFAFLANEFNVLIVKKFSVARIEMVQHFSFVQKRFCVVE